MPYIVNGHAVSGKLIKEELGRIGRDPQSQQTPDPNVRTRRLHMAAEQCTQDRILLEQAAVNGLARIQATDHIQSFRRGTPGSNPRFAFRFDSAVAPLPEGYRARACGSYRSNPGWLSATSKTPERGGPLE